MAKNSNRFDLNKGTERKFDIDKGPKRSFNLSKDIDDEAAEAIDVPPTVKQPTMQVPASVEVPEVNRTTIDEAITEGPEQPKRKNTAWLWALIGIAIVLAVIAMILTRKSDDSTDANNAADIENVATAPADDEATASDEPAIAESSDEVGSESNEATQSGSEAGSAEEASKAAADANASQAAADAQSAPAAVPAASTTPAKENAAAAPAPAKQSTPVATKTPTGNLEEDAKLAIRGNFGDGSARKAALGDRYSEVQRIVNERMRSGKY